MDDRYAREAWAIFGTAPVEVQPDSGLVVGLKALMRLLESKGHRLRRAYAETVKSYTFSTHKQVAQELPPLLARWRRSLVFEQSDSQERRLEFVPAMHRDEVMNSVVTAEEAQAICAYFAEGLLERMDREPVTHYVGNTGSEWIEELNSISIVAPFAHLVFPAWWRCETEGRAMCALRWLKLLTEDPMSKLVALRWCYFIEDGWHEANVKFLREYATSDLLAEVGVAMVNTLKNTDAFRIADEVAERLDIYRDFVQRRMNEYLAVVALPDPVWARVDDDDVYPEAPIWSPRNPATDP